MNKKYSKTQLINKIYLGFYIYINGIFIKYIFLLKINKIIVDLEKVWCYNTTRLV